MSHQPNGAWSEAPSGPCLSWEHRFSAKVVLTIAWGLSEQDLMLWLSCQEPERKGRGRMEGGGWSRLNMRQSRRVWLCLYLNWTERDMWIRRENGADERKKNAGAGFAVIVIRHGQVSAPVIWNVNERLKPSAQKAVFLILGNTKKDNKFSLPFHPSALACTNTLGAPELIFQLQDILA